MTEEEIEEWRTRIQADVATKLKEAGAITVGTKVRTIPAKNRKAKNGTVISLDPGIDIEDHGHFVVSFEDGAVEDYVHFGGWYNVLRIIPDHNRWGY